MEFETNVEEKYFNPYPQKVVYSNPHCGCFHPFHLTGKDT